MTRFYADENFPLPTVEKLRKLGHDVLTSAEAGHAKLAVPDTEILRFAHSQDRAILTFDRRDYIRFHLADEPHAGIIACTFDAGFTALAGRIHAAVTEAGSLNRKLVRVTRSGHVIEDTE